MFPRLSSNPLLYLALVAGVLISSLVISTSRDGDPPVHKFGPGFDHALIKGPDECTECHKDTGEIWKKTPHYNTLMDRSRSDEGAAIAKKMGIRRIRKDSLCLDCHSTAIIKREKTTPLHPGVSCESCHGASEPWLERHGKFSGKKEGEETPEEIAARWSESEAGGMLRPKAIVDIARNCVSCHVVTGEELVEVGGHSAGSEFELVSWSQGIIRHNVWYTNGAENKVASPERQRVLFVVGTLCELEVIIECVANSTAGSTYRTKQSQRAESLVKRLEEIVALTPKKPLVEALEALRGLDFSAPDPDKFTAASNAIKTATEGFAENHDGSGLEGIDPLLPTPDLFRGGEPKK